MIRVVHANDPLALVRTEDPILGGVTFSAASTAVYIGRASRRANNPIAHVDSPYRNPWSIKDAMAKGLTEREAREYVLATHDRWLDGLIDEQTGLRDYVLGHLHELRYSVLVCWCAEVGRPLTVADPLRCHGQNLALRVEAP